MKKVITGKMYDTDTAKAVGMFSRGNRYDFHFVSETLYKKKTGEFFLYGEGGAMSKYAVTIDCNSWCGGERITPITEDDAKEWAEINLDGDEYESIFGTVEE